MHKIAILQKIRDSGWRIIRQEGNHYVVEKDGVRSGFALLPTREIPNPTVADIFKKLGIIKGEKVTTQFRRKQAKRMPLPGTYGYELYNARAGKRVSAEDLGPAVGVSSTTIYNYESNRYTPDQVTQEKLATYLRWPALVVIKRADQLFEIEEKVYPAAQETEAVPANQLPGSSAAERASVSAGRHIRKSRKGIKLGPRRKHIDRLQRKVRAVIAEKKSSSTIQKDFDDAMVALRMVVNDLISAAEKWYAIKDLIKDDD